MATRRRLNQKEFEIARRKMQALMVKASRNPIKSSKIRNSSHRRL